MNRRFGQTVITRGLGRKLKKGVLENMTLAIRAFQFHAEIKLFEKGKDGEASGLIIEGYASTKDLDAVGDIVEPSAFEGSIKEFLTNPVLTYMHDWSNPIGKILEARIDDKGLFVKAFISETASRVIKLIEEGILRALSIGYEVLEEKMVDKVNLITELNLYEIAVVSIPANRRCLFSVAKALEIGTDLRCADCKGCADPLMSTDTFREEIAEIRKKLEAQLRKEAADRETFANIGAAVHDAGELPQQENELDAQEDALIEEVRELAEAGKL